jgi:hypothetical protein
MNVKNEYEANYYYNRESAPQIDTHQHQQLPNGFNVAGFGGKFLNLCGTV